MSFATFCAGPYTATWAGSALGMFVGGETSPTIDVTRYGQPIANTDLLGRTKIGVINQGSDAMFVATFTEWKAAVIAALVAAQGGLGRVGVVGSDDYNLTTGSPAGASAPLVLTAFAGSLAAAAGPASVTASLAAPAENNSYRLLLGPVLRETVIRMNLFPYVSSSVNVHFTTVG